ncbi:MAG: hypothetical protein ACFFG0_11990 [Candidatus Thorarchaeota archaeon]
MNESQTIDDPITWHWTEISKDVILRESKHIRHIRNKLKEEKKHMNKYIY